MSATIGINIPLTKKYKPTLFFNGNWSLPTQQISSNLGVNGSFNLNNNSWGLGISPSIGWGNTYINPNIQFYKNNAQPITYKRDTSLQQFSPVRVQAALSFIKDRTGETPQVTDYNTLDYLYHYKNGNEVLDWYRKQKYGKR